MAKPYLLKEYHEGEYRSWRGDGHKPRGNWVGIELELEHTDGYEAILEAIPKTDNHRLRPETEMDHSLDEDRGAEIIFPPFRYREIRRDNFFFARTLKKLEQAGVQINNFTGMHFNINTTGWSVPSRTIFAATLHNTPVDALTKIGGRIQNGYWDLNPCGRLGDYESSNLDKEINPKDDVFYSEHLAYHESVANTEHENRIEVRFPKATTDLNRVKLILEFLEILSKFAKSVKVKKTWWDSPTDTLFRDFQKYLAGAKTSDELKKIIVAG